MQTVDFFTPLVDDPFTFGQIAATNALSDVYAMGGRPLTALAVVCFPQDGDMDVLEQIMRGGLAKMAEAGCTVVGGHTVRDAEIKFGYAVTGIIDPERVYTNADALPGDFLDPDQADWNWGDHHSAEAGQGRPGMGGRAQFAQ